MRQQRQRHRLQPNPAGPGERHEVESVAAEHHVRDARYAGDLELDGALEHPDVAGVHQQRLPERKFVASQLAGELDPRPALALELLQDESVTTPQATAEALLQADAGHDPGCAAEPAVPVHEVDVTALDVHRHDVAWHLGRECDRARAPVAGQEEAAAANHALETLHEPAAATAAAHGL